MQNMSEKTRKLRSEYLKYFDPQKLNEQFYTVELKQHEVSLLFCYEATKEYHRANCKPGEKIKLLDFGCASNPIHVAAAAASGAILEIVMSDFLPQNRDYLRKWISGEEFKVFDSQFHIISKLSGKSSDEVKRKTRESIIKIESYDLFQDLSRDYGLYHVVLSSHTLECSSTCQEEYEEHMKKLVGLLAKGGTLVMSGSLGLKNYSNGQAFLECFPLSEDFLRKLIPCLGLQLLRMEANAKEENTSKTADLEGSFTFFARKIA